MHIGDGAAKPWDQSGDRSRKIWDDAHSYGRNVAASARQGAAIAGPQRDHVCDASGQHGWHGLVTAFAIAAAG